MDGILTIDNEVEYNRTFVTLILGLEVRDNKRAKYKLERRFGPELFIPLLQSYTQHLTDVLMCKYLDRCHVDIIRYPSYTQVTITSSDGVNGYRVLVSNKGLTSPESVAAALAAFKILGVDIIATGIAKHEL